MSRGQVSIFVKLQYWATHTVPPIILLLGWQATFSRVILIPLALTTTQRHFHPCVMCEPFGNFNFNYIMGLPTVQKIHFSINAEILLSLNKKNLFPFYFENGFIALSVSPIFFLYLSRSKKYDFKFQYKPSEKLVRSREFMDTNQQVEIQTSPEKLILKNSI